MPPVLPPPRYTRCHKLSRAPLYGNTPHKSPLLLITKDHPLQQESPSSSSPSSSSRCPSVSSHERDYTTRSVPTSTSSNSSSHCPAAPRRSCQAGRDNPSNEHGDHEHHNRPPSHASHIIFRYAAIFYSPLPHDGLHPTPRCHFLMTGYTQRPAATSS